MAEHTPGPWSFDRDWHRIPTIFGPDGRQMVATIEKGTVSRDAQPTPERVANANLIAAAPDMLDALRAMDEFAWTAVQADCKESHDGLAERIAKVRAAIAKAEGK